MWAGKLTRASSRTRKTPASTRACSAFSRTACYSIAPSTRRCASMSNGSASDVAFSHSAYSPCMSLPD